MIDVILEKPAAMTVAIYSPDLRVVRIICSVALHFIIKAVTAPGLTQAGNKHLPRFFVLLDRCFVQGQVRKCQTFVSMAHS